MRLALDPVSLFDKRPDMAVGDKELLIPAFATLEALLFWILSPRVNPVSSFSCPEASG